MSPTAAFPYKALRAGSAYLVTTGAKWSATPHMLLTSDDLESARAKPVSATMFGRKRIVKVAAFECVKEFYDSAR